MTENKFGVKKVNYLALLDVGRLNRTGIVLPPDPEYIHDKKEAFGYITREFIEAVRRTEGQ